MKKPSLCKKTPISVIQDKSPDLMLRRKLVTAVSVGFGLVTIATLVPLVESMAPSARARAEGGPVEINLSGIALGELRTIEWRQKPVWILRRTPEMLTRLQHHRNDLRDPDSKIDQQPVYAKNDTRSVKPEFFVAIGICTHLGCIPGFRPEIGGDLGSGLNSISLVVFLKAYPRLSILLSRYIDIYRIRYLLSAKMHLPKIINVLQYLFACRD
jgi:ubiquinol-cytochrome c reductase iron-sulfur subunit